MAATKADDEDGEKYANRKSVTPPWGADARIGDHLWIRSSSSGDSCYVGSSGCTAHGQKKRRIKCASCKICVHTDCLRVLMGSMKVFCRKTFQDAENGNYRENTDVPHHWVAKKAAKGKCRTCGKSCGGKVCNLLNEYSMSCSWCKEVCHNKDTCFDANKFSTESCNLGAHSNLIVPSTWIVKLPEEEAENTKTVFVVKPIPSRNYTPLLVFINPKSGGNQGSKLMRTFQWLLNPRQVFDLTEGGPGLGLELYKRVPNLRILACGGDGTVGWVLSILDKMKLCASPPVAVLPLGTGNDLARALGWGGGYTDEPIPRILANIEVGEISRLDRWILKVSPNGNASNNNSKEEARKDLPLCVVNNYFSLGVDAHVALEFHEAREANPQKFNSRIRNKMFYGQAGGKDLILRKWKDLSNFVTLECDGQDVTAKLRDLKVHAILFLNICSYGGGTRPWGGGNQFRSPSTEDGLIEVIGLTTYQLPLLQAGGHGSSIAQCRKAKLVTSCTVPVQVDGEPCRLLPSIVEVDLLNTVNMVARAKKQGAAMKKENVEITLPLKLIPLSKYEAEHQRKSALKDKAVDFGQFTLTYSTELKEIRSKVAKLLDEKTKDNSAKDKNGRRCSKVSNWWFLDSCSGGKFYRIDEAQEHLFYVNDVCDEELYVLGESDSPDERNDNLRAGTDDVSRISTSSSGRQSLEESGEEREAQEEGEEEEYEEGEYEEGEYEEGEYEEGEYEEGEYEEGEYEEGEYEEGEYDEEEGEYEEGEYETEGGPFIPSPDYADGLTPTQIFVESASDIRSLDHDVDESELMENAKDLLAIPEKRSSISSLQIDESEMDLITAAKFGNLNRVAELHNAGISLAEKDHEGRTALHHAAFIGNMEVVRYLAAYAPIGILDARDDMMYQTALHRAALRGDRKVCSVLVSAGASLDIRDKQGCTAQDLAEAVGDKNLSKYLETMATPVIL